MFAFVADLVGGACRVAGRGSGAQGRVIVLVVVLGLLTTTLPPNLAAASSDSVIATDQAAQVVDPVEGPGCVSLLDRLSALSDCVADAFGGPGLTVPAAPVYARAPDGGADQPESAEQPDRGGFVELPADHFCAGDSAAVVGDPLGDWDADGFSNVHELYAPSDPCSASDVPATVELETPLIGAAPRGAVGGGTEVVTVAADETDGGTQPPPAADSDDEAAGDGEPAEVVVCPDFSLDEVLADPDGDWDRDGVSNKDEFYDNADPCVSNGTTVRTPAAKLPVTVCPGFTADDVVADPTGDWDGDRVSNRDEFYNGENPCRYDDPSGRALRPSIPEPDPICAGFSVSDVNADPEGDWDGDKVTNKDEFYNNADPCRYDDPALRTVPTATPTAAGSCPSFSIDQVLADPDTDWDRDGVSNKDEFFNNADPCTYVDPAARPNSLLTDPIAAPNPYQGPSQTVGPPVRITEAGPLPTVTPPPVDPSLRAPQLATPVVVDNPGFAPVDRSFVEREDGSIATSDLGVNVIINAGAGTSSTTPAPAPTATAATSTPESTTAGTDTTAVTPGPTATSTPESTTAGTDTTAVTPAPTATTPPESAPTGTDAAGPAVVLRSAVGDFGLNVSGSRPERAGVGGRLDKAVLVGAGDGGDVSVHLEPTGSGVKVVFEVPSRESFGAGLIKTLSLPEGWSAVQDGVQVLLLDPSGSVGGSWSGGPVWDGANTPGPDARIELVSVADGTATVRVVVDEGWVNDPARVFPLHVDPLIAIVWGSGDGTSSTLTGTPIATSARPGSATAPGAPGDVQILVTNTSASTWAAGSRCFYYGIYSGNTLLQPWQGHNECVTDALAPGQTRTVTAHYQLTTLPAGSYSVVFQLMYAVTGGLVSAGSGALSRPFTATSTVLDAAPSSNVIYSSGQPLVLSVAGSGFTSYRFSIQQVKSGVSPTNCLTGMNGQPITLGTSTTGSWTVPVATPAGTYFWCGQGVTGAVGAAERVASPWEARVINLQSLQNLGLLGLKDGQDAVVKGVDVGSGNWAFDRTDVELGAVGPALGLRRVYNSFDQTPGIFGVGWSSSLEMSLSGLAGTATGGMIILTDADGATVHYTPGLLGGPVTGPAVQTTAFGSVLWNQITRWDGPGGNTSWVERDGTGFRVWYLDGTSRLFNTAGWLSQIASAAGNAQELLYSGTTPGSKLTQVRDVVSGRALNLTYGGANPAVVTSVSVADPSAPTGNSTWTYTYSLPDSSTPWLNKVCSPLFCENYSWGDVFPSTVGPMAAIFWVLDHRNYPVEEAAFDDRGRVTVRRSYEGGDANGWVRGQTTFTYQGGTPFVSPVSTAVLDANGGTWTYGFDSQMRYVTKTAPGNLVTTYGYDTTSGMMSTITDANNNTSRLFYDSRRRLTERRNALNQSTRYHYDQTLTRPTNDVIAECNHLAGTVIVNDYCVRNVYNTYGQLTSRTTPLTSGVFMVDTWAYAGVGRKVSTSTEAGVVTTYTYATNGDLQTVTLATGGTRTFTYNRWGQVATITERESATATPVVVQTTTFDKIGRAIQVDGPLVTNPITGIQHRNRVVNTYQPWGPLEYIYELDAVSPSSTRRTTLFYDLQGREYIRVDAEGGQTSRQFDRNGNVTKVCDARQNCVRSDYNALNQLTSTWAEAYNGGTTDVRLSLITYDNAGRVLTETDANGTVIRHAYDPADRRTSSTLENLDGTGRNVRLSETTYNSLGQATTVQEGGTAGPGNPAMRTTTVTYNLAGWSPLCR